MPILFFATLPLIALFWVIMVRPQQQRMREQQALVETLQVGDRVISAGGIHGTVVAVADDTIELQVTDTVVLTMARPAVARRLDAEAEAEAATGDAALDEDDQDDPAPPTEATRAPNDLPPPAAEPTSGEDDQ